MSKLVSILSHNFLHHLLRAPVKQSLQSLAYPFQVLASSYLHLFVLVLLVGVSHDPLTYE